jgi:hypothetical protein
LDQGGFPDQGFQVLREKNPTKAVAVSTPAACSCLLSLKGVQKLNTFYGVEFTPSSENGETVNNIYLFYYAAASYRLPHRM